MTTSSAVDVRLDPIEECVARLTQASEALDALLVLLDTSTGAQHAEPHGLYNLLLPISGEVSCALDELRPMLEEVPA